MKSFDGVRVGDTLLVVDERPNNSYDFVGGMYAYLGLEVTVADVSTFEQKVWIEEDDGAFYWKPWFFSEHYNKNDISCDDFDEIGLSGLFPEE